MCVYDPKIRISANDALKHPYLVSLGMGIKSEENFDVDEMNEDINNNIAQYKQK